jgi:alpha,alpha-trehalase
MTKLSKNPYPFADSELFKAVQMSDIFPDSKTFTDYIPVRSLEKIEAKYLKKYQLPGFDLNAFVEKHFHEKSFQSIDYQSDSAKSIEQHLGDLWQILRREPAVVEGSLIDIPYPYVVPGGRFQEIYYWDSYFTILGLQVSRQIDLIENIVDNFAHLINRFGYIPNGNRTYFLGRSQPPFFSLMVDVLREEKGDEILLKYLPVLVKEYQFWMQDKEQLSPKNQASKRVVLLEKGVVLNRYWDDHDTPRPESYREDMELAKGSSVYPEGIFRDIRAAAESGWDFSSRWFKDGKNMSTIHTTEILPVDLNCLLFNLEKTIFRGYLLAGKKGKTDQYFALANQREKAIEKYFFNEKKSFYSDYDFIEQSHKKNCTLAGIFPLFFHLSNSFQAKKIVNILEANFLKEGGLITTLNITGQQWDAPNGWAPLQYITYRGLANYGFMELANTIKSRWMQTNEKVYLATGKMTEKYNVETTNIEAGGGEYPNQDGFGWTNGVYLKFSSFK